MTIDAMKQALEALEYIHTETTEDEDELIHAAITALRLAIEQAEKQEPLAWHHPDCEGECIACLIEREVEVQYGTQGLAYLRRHVSAPQVTQQVTQQEPRGYFTINDYDMLEQVTGTQGIPLYEAPQPCPTCEALARTVMMDQTGRDA